MKELPINKKDYDYSVLVTDFLGKLKKYNYDNDEKYNFKFCPKLKGYEILFDFDNNHFIIQIKRNMFNGLYVKLYKNGILDLKRIYFSRTSENNEIIINKIFK